MQERKREVETDKDLIMSRIITNARAFIRTHDFTFYITIVEAR